jgi:hypothetical protein
MTPELWIRIIIAAFAALPPTIASVAALVVAVRNGKKSDQIHQIVNGQAKANQQAAYTQGRADEKAGVGKAE